MTLAQRNLELSVNNFLKQKSVKSNVVAFSSSTPTRMGVYEAAVDTLEKTVSKYSGPNTKLYVVAHDWMINNMLSKACSAMTCCGRSVEASEIMTKLTNSETELERTFKEIDYSECLEHGSEEDEILAHSKGFRSFGELKFYEKMHVTEWFVKAQGNIWEPEAIQDFQDYLDEFLPLHV
jgi:hypothetical protein